MQEELLDQKFAVVLGALARFLAGGGIVLGALMQMCGAPLWLSLSSGALVLTLAGTALIYASAASAGESRR